MLYRSEPLKRFSFDLAAFPVVGPGWLELFELDRLKKIA
jgi:hypothetical protein